MRPYVYVNPAPIKKIESISSRLVSGVGFTLGEAELALTKPPPLVPSSLLISCDAIGPPVIDCLKPSSDATSWYAWKFCGIPCQTRSRAPTKLIGTNTYNTARVISTQKVPRG